MAAEDIEVLANFHGEYEIAFIAGKRIFEGKKQYHVVWADNWINEEDLSNARNKIQEYEAEKRKETRITSTKRKLCEGEIPEVIMNSNTSTFASRKSHWLLQKLNKRSDAKEYSCRECDVVLNRKDNLHRHSVSVHDKTKKFACETCDRKFTRLSNLKYHNEHKVCQKFK